MSEITHTRTHNNTILSNLHFSISQPFTVPTFEQLIKNRVLCERKFYLSNSNSKWLSIGVKPSTKILDESATGFQTEILLGGEKGTVSLGGIEGAATLFKTFRGMQQFAPMYTAQKFDFPEDCATNIIITKANFGNEVIIGFLILFPLFICNCNW